MLHYTIVRPEASNTEDFPVFSNEQAGPPERRSRYQLHLPYTIALRLSWGGTRGMVYFFAAQPIDVNRCAGYVVIGRNYNFDQPDEVIREFEDAIFGQDQVVVESQRPERVPFDLAAELHLKFDAVAVAYRKAMRANGLAASTWPIRPQASAPIRRPDAASRPSARPVRDAPLMGTFFRNTTENRPGEQAGGSTTSVLALARRRDQVPSGRPAGGG